MDEGRTHYVGDGCPGGHADDARAAGIVRTTGDTVTALDRLRTIAEQASPGPWAHGCLPGINPRDNRVYATQVPDGDHPWTTVLDGEAAFDDARFIATFDPETVLALLDVAEAAAKADAEDCSSPGLHLALSSLDLHLALKRLREETP